MLHFSQVPARICSIEGAAEFPYNDSSLQRVPDCIGGATGPEGWKELP